MVALTGHDPLYHPLQQIHRPGLVLVLGARLLQPAFGTRRPPPAPVPSLGRARSSPTPRPPPSPATPASSTPLYHQHLLVHRPLPAARAGDHNADYNIGEGDITTSQIGEGGFASPSSSSASPIHQVHSVHRLFHRPVHTHVPLRIYIHKSIYNIYSKGIYSKGIYTATASPARAPASRAPPQHEEGRATTA